jgi:hypothetical protein
MVDADPSNRSYYTIPIRGEHGDDGQPAFYPNVKAADGFVFRRTGRCVLQTAAPLARSQADNRLQRPSGDALFRDMMFAGLSLEAGREFLV